MGMSPKVYVSASFYMGVHNSELEYDALMDELDEHGFLVARNGDDFGVDGNYKPGYVTVFTWLTNGWGDSLSVEEFKSSWDSFADEVTEFCVNKKKCKLPSFKIGATYN